MLNLFIFGCTGSSLLLVGFVQLQWAGATLCWGAQASQYAHFSSCVVQAPGTQASAIVIQGLRALAQELRHKAFRCSEGCAIFLDQGLDLCSLHRQVDSYPLYHQGSPLLAFYQQFWLLLRHWLLYMNFTISITNFLKYPIRNLIKVYCIYMLNVYLFESLQFSP